MEIAENPTMKNAEKTDILTRAVRTGVFTNSVFFSLYFSKIWIVLKTGQVLTQKRANLGPVFNSTAYIYIYICMPSDRAAAYIFGEMFVTQISFFSSKAFAALLHCKDFRFNSSPRVRVWGLTLGLGCSFSR